MRGINRNAVKFNNNSQITPLRGRTCSCKPSFLFPPRRRRAYSQANQGLQLSVQFLHHSIRVVCCYGRATI